MLRCIELSSYCTCYRKLQRFHIHFIARQFSIYAFLNHSTGRYIKRKVFLFQEIPVSAYRDTDIMQFLSLHLVISLSLDIGRQQRISQSGFYGETFRKGFTYGQSETYRLMMFIIHHGSRTGLQIRNSPFKYNFLICGNIHGPIHNCHQVYPVAHWTGCKTFRTIRRKSSPIAYPYSHRPFSIPPCRRTLNRQLVFVFTGWPPGLFPFLYL